MSTEEKIEEPREESSAPAAENDAVDEAYPEENGDSPPSEPTLNYSPLQALFHRDVLRRSRRNSERLRAILTGKILFDVDESPVAYVIDWSSEDLEVTEVSEKEELPEVECTISLTEDDLFGISKGNLNPQVCLLSDRIQVEGQMELAMYAFNLFRPGSR